MTFTHTEGCVRVRIYFDALTERLFHHTWIHLVLMHIFFAQCCRGTPHVDTRRRICSRCVKYAFLMNDCSDDGEKYCCRGGERADEMARMSRRKDANILSCGNEMQVTELVLKNERQWGGRKKSFMWSDLQMKFLVRCVIRMQMNAGSSVRVTKYWSWSARRRVRERRTAEERPPLLTRNQ